MKTKEGRTIRNYVSNMSKKVKAAITAGTLLGAVSAAPLYAETDIGISGYVSSPQTSLNAKIDREEFGIPESVPSSSYEGWGLSDRPSVGAELNLTFNNFGLDVGGVLEPLSAYMGSKDFLSADISTHRLYANARLQTQLGNITPFIAAGLNYSFWDARAKADMDSINEIALELIGSETGIKGVNPYLEIDPGLGWQAFVGAKAKITDSVNLVARLGYLGMNSGLIKKAIAEITYDDGTTDTEEIDVQELIGDIKLTRSGPVAEIGVSVDL